MREARFFAKSRGKDPAEKKTRATRADTHGLLATNVAHNRQFG